MTTLIPTSGDFLRLFSRTPMAAATWRVAATIAGHISYDGRYRGAPKGHSAWTMAELQSETGLSERSVRDALAELARLFGLIIHRRHHQPPRLVQLVVPYQDRDRGRGVGSVGHGGQCLTW